jgi:hypothetical protein
MSYKEARAIAQPDPMFTVATARRPSVYTLGRAGARPWMLRHHGDLGRDGSGRLARQLYEA